jgi:hypothetical protein
MTEPNVIDQQANDRFVIEADGHAARLEYRAHGDRLILIHTDVPEALEGRGLGGLLVRAALDRARAEELTIVPWCKFARGWLERHEDEAATVDIDWDSQP